MTKPKFGMLKPMGIATYITLSRIVFIPIFVLLYILPFHWGHIGAAVLFSVMCLTDWLDGYIARLLGQTSPLGSFLDPVADKLLIVIALVLLVGNKSLHFLAIPAMVIISREIVISALREWMAEIGSRTSVAVSYIGKFKTAIQMVALILLLAYTPGYYPWVGILGYIAIYLATALTLWSMVMYLRAAWPDLLVQKNNFTHD